MRRALFPNPMSIARPADFTRSDEGDFVHASLGSKILQGERSLTVDPIRKRAARFQVRPRRFLDGGE